MALVGLFVLAVLPAQAQVTGVSYTLSPLGQRVFWDDNAGLDEGYLYGGEIGFGFGQYLQLGALYQIGNEFETDFSDFDAGGSARSEAIAEGLAGLEAREVDLRRYGGQLRLNLGAGEVVPFATVGGGVIEFDPQGLDESRNIYGTAGLGLTFSALDRFTLSVSGELLSYRYNPATTFLSDDDLAAVNGGLEEPVERGDFSEQIVYNPSVRAALRLYLGGRDPDELTELDRALLQQFRDGGLQLFVEPFYGRIEFNEALGFPSDQNLAGVNAGIELGPYVGLRGFYWRGTTGDDVFDEFAEDFEDIAFYGGELNLRFGTTVGQRSFVPYGILGGGYMDVLSGYDEDLPGGATPPESRYFATAGGGIEVPLSSALKLQGEARYLFMSNEDVEEVDMPSDVYGSLMYSAGIELSIGGGGGRTPGEILQARAEEREARTEARVEAERAERMRSAEAMQEVVEELQARIDSLEEAQQQVLTAEQEEEMEAMREEMQREVQRLQEQRLEIEQQQEMGEDRRRMAQRPMERGAPAQRRPGSNLSGETIVVPVPERGEIYIRFGEGPDGQVTTETMYAPPTVVMPQGGAVQQQGMPQQQAPRGAEGRAALSDEEIRQIVRQTIREELEGLSAGEAGQMQVNQLRDQLDRMEQRLTQRIQEAEEEARRAARAGTTVPDIEIETGGGEETEARIIGGDYVPNRVVPTAGYAVGDASRFLVGVRGDYGGQGGFDVGSYGLRFMPELMVGLGDGLSLDLIANGVVDLNVLQPYLPIGLTPYTGAGLGLSTEAGLGINLILGTEYDIGGGAVFGEFSTLDFFDYNRFLIGYRTRF